MRSQGGRAILGLATAVALLLPAAACSDDDDPEARLELDEGSARIVRQDGEEEEVDDAAVVRFGDEVTLVEGSGRLELPGDAVLELRAGLGDDSDTVLVMGPRPALEGGDLLVEVDGSLEVTAAETVIGVTAGAARITQAAGLEVASYTATVNVDSAGQEREVVALREIQVPALGLPAETSRPLDYDPEDPWDRRFLAEAMELGDRLEALGRGYTQNLGPGDGRTVGFYRGVLVGLVDEPDFTAELLTPSREAGETLIGASIADLGRRGTFAERWASVFAFRDAGASWGLVALDQGVDGGSLLDAVTDAVESTELAIAPPPQNGGAVDGGGVGGDDDGGGDGGTGGASGPSTTPTTRPRTDPSPPTTTDPPPVEEESEGLLPPLLGPIIDPVTDLLKGLVDGLLGGLFTTG